MDPLSTSVLFSQFLDQRRYLKNVTPSTIEWYETAFKALQRAGDAALGVNALEIADQQQPEIDPRRQSRSAHRLRIKASALRFDEIVEPVFAQQLIQAPIKRVACSRWQVRRRDPHRRLSIAFALAHRHGRSVVRDVGRVDHAAWPASRPC